MPVPRFKNGYVLDQSGLFFLCSTTLCNHYMSSIIARGKLKQFHPLFEFINLFPGTLPICTLSAICLNIASLPERPITEFLLFSVFLDSVSMLLTSPHLSPYNVNARFPWCRHFLQCHPHGYPHKPDIRCHVDGALSSI